MGSNRSRVGVMVGLSAAAGVFGVAAMMSAATAPTARADDFGDIISAVDGDFANGQADFTTAFADFGSGDVTNGLPAFFDGLDNDLLSPEDTLLVGTLEVLTNVPVSGAADYLFNLGPLTTSALTQAEIDFSVGEADLTTGAADLSGGEYLDAVYFDLIGSEVASVVPVEALLQGVVASF
jgi:hypothetical protein